MKNKTLYYQTNQSSENKYYKSYNPPQFSIFEEDTLLGSVYIYFKNDCFMEMALSDDGYFNGFILFAFDTIKFYCQSFEFEKLLTVQKELAFSMTDESFEKLLEAKYIDLKTSIYVEIFSNNTLVLWMDDKSNSDRFFIENSSAIGMIVDFNLYLKAIVIRGYSNEELKEFLNFYNINEYEREVYEKNELSKVITMENEKYFIEKIIELKNTNILELLYFGIKKDLFENQFLINFAMQAISNNPDPALVEIAGLLDYEQNKAGEILESYIKDKDQVLVKNAEYYNKIWFYLVLATDMCAQNLIK